MKVALEGYQPKDVAPKHLASEVVFSTHEEGKERFVRIEMVAGSVAYVKAVELARAVLALGGSSRYES